MARLTIAAAAGAAAAAGLAATSRAAAFLVAPPSAGAQTAAGQRHTAPATGASLSQSTPGAAAGVAIGAHVGLALAAFVRRPRASPSKRRAAEGKEVATKYVESATDQRLFEQVYTDYTAEYLKGPMYWHEDKLQGVLPQYPGEPIFMENRLTSNVVGNLKTFSSNELAFLAFLFFGIGLYGNLMFNVYDPQWIQVATGNDFNVSYIVESFFLPISFFFHIACYIQRKNGK